MDSETIRGALGELQQDPDASGSWDKLKAAVADDGGKDASDLQGLLAAARQAHAERGEWDAVANLLPMEVELQPESGEKIGLLMELGRVRQQELLDESGAVSVFKSVLEIVPDDELTQAALAENQERQSRWQELANAYQSEADSAPDEVYKASMLMRIAEVEWRFAGDQLDEDRVLGLLAQAAEADPKNQTVLQMLERIYRKKQDHKALAQVLERWFQYSTEPSARIASALRLARLKNHRLGDEEGAAAAYEDVLSVNPNQQEAMETLVEHYSARENWDKLVQLYERQLRNADLKAQERLGDMLQIGMLHWRKRKNLTDAAVWFDHVRLVEPTNGAMLDFFREYSAETGDEGKLLEVLQETQRVLSEGQAKQQVTQEIAKLAEGQEDAKKAIDQYRSLLRQDPDNAEARESLKSLYRKTQEYKQLVDLLRQQLERLPDNDTTARVNILTEVASVYRDHVPNDNSLVSALNQILQADEKNAPAVRELIGLYERLGRGRDLLMNQQRLVDLTEDEGEKIELLRAAGRRWLSQFSNVQNATQAFEQLLAVSPHDREARDSLSELYKKRRAWPDLFALYESELPSLEGARRTAVMKEMAQLAADRLGKGEVASKLYLEILETEPGSAGVLDALEKQAERARDWPLLASALERRLATQTETNDKVTVLQKLGSVYSEQLSDAESAAGAWRRVLDLQPGQARALRVLRDTYLSAADYDALTALYTSQSDFEGLADVLTTAADRSESIRTKIDLSYRAAAVFEEQLQAPERAIRSYERILSADPMDGKAAERLVPIYESEEKWARLPALYELLLTEQTEKSEQVETYRKLADVSAHRLGDRAAGVAYARKAYELAPAEAETLELFESACREAGNWDALVEAVEAQLAQHRAAAGQSKAKKKRSKKSKRKSQAPSQPPPGGLDAGTVRRLELRLADVYDQHLNKTAEAVSTLQRLLNEQPADADAARALESLLRRENKPEELRWLFGLRVEHAVDDPSRIGILREWASLEEDGFQDMARAADLFRRVVDASPEDDEALGQLSRLLLALNEPAEAAEVLERRRDLANGENLASREADLAEVYLNRLERHVDALQSASRVIELGGETSRAVEVLQRLVEVPATKAQAAKVLAEVYHQGQEWRREAETLAVLLSVEEDSAKRRELYARTIEVQDQLGSHSAAFELILKACREFPSELELWTQAQGLSEKAGRPTELAEAYRDAIRAELPETVVRTLCESAAALHEDELGDPVGATPYLEKVLSLDPTNQDAFAKLKQILTSAQRWSELQALYDRMVSATDDSEVKIEFLGEVAMISEEFMDDPKGAVRYFEQIRVVDPQQVGALEALDRLYSRHEQYDQLVELLRTRLELSAGEEATAFRLRLAVIHLDQLHQPDAALSQVEQVLSDNLSNGSARELAERILQIGSLRGAAAALLERVYEARDEIRELVRVLQIRLDVVREGKGGADTDASIDSGAEAEERQILRNIAQLKNERLRDDPGAMAALSELVPLEPNDQEARASLLEVSKRLGTFEQVAQVLASAADRSEDLHQKSLILREAAEINDQALHRPDQAEALYRQVIEMDPGNVEMVVPAAKALERIYSDRAEYPALTKILRVQLELEHDPDARSQSLARIAELCENQLADIPGAIAAWRRRLDDSPEDQLALSSLDRLYQQSQQWDKLVGVLGSRRDLATEEAERRDLMRRIATVQSEQLANTSEAVEAHQALIDEFGPDVETLRALEELFTRDEKWEELADTLGTHLELAESTAERLDMQANIGDLQRQHLGNLSGALESYREVVSEDSSHGRARAALEELLAADNDDTRRDAAEVLLPLYEGDANSEKLLSVLDILTDCEDDPVARLEVLERSIQVSDDALQDSERALGYAARALKEAAGHVDLGPWLDEFERLSAATDRRKEQVALLKKIAPDIFDGEVQFSVLQGIAILSRDQLGDHQTALEYFQKALEVRPDAPEALTALEALYTESEDHDSLLEVLERRADTASDDSERKELLLRRGQLLDQKLAEPARAIAVFENLIDIDLDPRATEALAELYSRESRWEELIELYQRQLEAGSEPADMRVKIAGVVAGKLKDPFRAFDELEAALELKSHHEGAIELLEQLMDGEGSAEQRARAATLLEPIYLVRADYDRVMRTLEARLEYADVPDDRRELLQRLAKLFEEQKEDYASALETVAKILADDPQDESVIAELERLAKVADKQSRLAELYAAELERVSSDDEHSARMSKRTGELYRELGTLDKALTYYRRALTFEPDSQSLFAAVDEILEQLEQHEDRVELHRAALEHRYEPQDRLGLLHTVGTLQTEKLDRKTEAITTYSEILELKEDDAVGLDTLGRLYYETKRYEDLYELVLRLAENAADQRAAIAYRLELARLCKNELKDISRAIDQLEEVVRVSPGDAGAIEQLEELRGNSEHQRRVIEILLPLYEQADAWRHIIKLNEDRFQLADHPSEKVEVLRETARLWEERGGDPTKARQGLSAAVQLDPDDAEVRSEFERLTEVTGASDPRAWDGLAQVYTTILEKNPDLPSVRELWSKLAKTHDGPRDDPRAALKAYDKLRELEPSDLEPVERMESLATLLSDWETLDQVLVSKSELVISDDERAAIWRRVGEGRRDMLDNQPGAVEAYERALEFEPESTFAIDCLTDLYEQEGKAERLVELYQQRVELSDESETELRYNLLLLCAERHEEDFDDRNAAIDALRQALANVPGDSAVLERLNRLHRQEQQWPELLDNMKAQADVAESVGARAELRFQMGQILSQQLESYDEALDTYRLALEDVPTHLQARAAAKNLGQEHEDLRETVASVLLPALGVAEAHGELIDVLELRLSVESDPSQRASTLRQIAEVNQTHLGDDKASEKALLRAVAEVPEDLELHRQLEQLCGTTGDWGPYADALADRAQNTFETELAQDLLSRLGRISEEHLQDLPRAIDAYQKAVEQVGDQADLLQSLDRLCEATSDWSQLGDILERRTVLVDSDQERADLYHRLGSVQLQHFNEPGQALGSLRSALELNPFHEGAMERLENMTERRDLFEEVSEVLESVYRSRATTDKLAALFEKRVSFAETAGERSEMRQDLARVLEQELGDPNGAQTVMQQGLIDDLSDEAQLDEVDRLATITNDWVSAAEALRSAIDRDDMLSGDQGLALCLRLAKWYRERAVNAPAAEKALEKALEFEPNSEDVLVELEDLQSVPGRELARVETMLRRARLQYDEQRREEIYRNAQGIAASQGAGEKVEAIVRELLQHDETNAWALSELCTLREAAGDYEETFALTLRQIEVALDGAEAASLRLKAAQLAQTQLGDREKAVELYAQLFEDDPLDGTASGELRRLYMALGRDDDLARLLERLVDVADTPEQRSVLRLELANLNQDKFQARDSAIEVLQVVLEDDPGNSEAVVMLSRLYQEAGQDEELAELLNHQIGFARERGDEAAELRFEVRLGEVYETKLGDKQRAIETFDRVLSGQPHHVEALTAIARLYRETERHSEAAHALGRLLELQEGAAKVSVATDLAAVYRSLDNLGAAASALERALEVQPDAIEVRAQLRQLYRDIGAWPELGELIADDAEREQDPATQVQLLQEAATIFSEKQQDEAKAAELLERAVALKQDDRQLLMRLCDAYSASGRADESVRVLEKIVESYGGRRSKELGEIHRRLATAFSSSGQLPRAVEELDKAFRIEPGNVHVLKALGELSLQVDDLKRAQQMFRALLLQKLTPESPITKAEVFYHLGLVHHRLGEKAKATQMLERALQTDSELSSAKDLLAQVRA